MEYTSVLAWIVFGLGFLSVYVLRVREPQLQRPYKVSFYRLKRFDARNLGFTGFWGAPWPDDIG